MALYAFDGTGDNWDTAPARDADIEAQTEAFNKVGPQTKVENGRFLTNVVLFAKEYNQSEVGRVEYFPGVGSGARFQTFIGRVVDFIFGGAFGFGARKILRDALEALKNNVKNGDTTIDIIAYSRGAAIARIFVDRISKNPTGFGFPEPPKIRFLGLFDTVASFGNPLDDRELLLELVFQESLPDNVENAFHAMSRDLNRIGFGLDRAYGKNLLEVWFRGGHGDIGGNSAFRPETDPKEPQANRKRTNITLNFMLRKAIAVGIELRDSAYEIDRKAPVVVDRSVTLNPLDWGRPGADPSRQHTNTDVFHYTFFDENNQQIGADMQSRRALAAQSPIDEWGVKRVTRLLGLIWQDLIDRFSCKDVPYRLRFDKLVSGNQIEDLISEGENHRLELNRIPKNDHDSGHESQGS